MCKAAASDGVRAEWAAWSVAGSLWMRSCGFVLGAICALAPNVAKVWAGRRSGVY